MKTKRGDGKEGVRKRGSGVPESEGKARVHKGFRLDEQYVARIEKLMQVTNQNERQIVEECLRRGLPELEEEVRILEEHRARKAGKLPPE